MHRELQSAHPQRSFSGLLLPELRLSFCFAIFHFCKEVLEHRLQVWFLPSTGTDAAVMHKLWNG